MATQEAGDIGHRRRVASVLGRGVADTAIIRFVFWVGQVAWSLPTLADLVGFGECGVECLGHAALF